ncbi:hypothetical protein HMPREF0372_00961 [Flavonifractor plautii ATCC 29863]|uniref:Uncharacterized protein n=1 Tax=Flavonifractor plautii ATCC 29863 TaxID=411475 RepID=G9YN89_FLAPL|nr:hypothetical protein HMPREF0372_00961 [Flavonifractor plautii ATCC 29863]
MNHRGQDRKDVLGEAGWAVPRRCRRNDNESEHAKESESKWL